MYTTEFKIVNNKYFPISYLSYPLFKYSLFLPTFCKQIQNRNLTYNFPSKKNNNTKTSKPVI